MRKTNTQQCIWSSFMQLNNLSFCVKWFIWVRVKTLILITFSSSLEISHWWTLFLASPSWDFSSSSSSLLTCFSSSLLIVICCSSYLSSCLVTCSWIFCLYFYLLMSCLSWKPRPSDLMEALLIYYPLLMVNLGLVPEIWSINIQKKLDATMSES